MQRLQGSAEATKQMIANLGLSATVMMMSELFPSLGDQEETSIQHLLKTELTDLQFMTTKRRTMYLNLGCFLRDEQIIRTARTAAQYLALGTLAAQQNLAVVNHTTVNLARYVKTDTALIHNPVEVY